MHALKDLLDMLNTDGGHIAIALLLVAVGLFCIVRWHVGEGKELFVAGLTTLTLAMKSFGRANGKGPTPPKE